MILIDCFNYCAVSLDLFHSGLQTLGNLTRLCGNCSKEYQKLVAFYHASVNDKSSFLLCLDVKQQINASVHEWSYVFKCGRLDWWWWLGKNWWRGKNSWRLK